MADSDTLYRTVAAAAAAVGERPAKINRLIYAGFLPTRRGESGSRGGRPAHIIARRDLVDALSRYDAWEKRNALEKPRPTPRPAAPPRGRARQASPRQRAKSAKRLYNEKRKIIRKFLNAGARPIKYRGKIRQR